jgi:hypothetical protein
MKYTSKQTGNSRNKALLRRAARLGCGISLVAVSAMLAARPARASDPVGPAGVLSSSVPSESSSGGFVTSGSAQTNPGEGFSASAITAYVNEVSGSSTVDNSNTDFEPSTASVIANKLAAYATGNAQTNTVDFASIGTGTISTGIAVLADQENTYSALGDDPVVYTPETINAAVTNSSLDNATTNAIGGDSLTDSSNLITAQVLGNVASSSVIGVVPINYDTPEAGSVITEPGSADANGNVVVASSQTDVAMSGGVGSFATLGSDDIILSVDSDGEDAQSLGFTATNSGNTASSVYLGNSAINDIGVALTAGTVTGAPSLDGSLVISNQQTSTQGEFEGSPNDGIGALTNTVSVGIAIMGDPTITLADGSATVDNNVISSSATNNSAVGGTGGPGNEITLGINLFGDTPTQLNTISSADDLATSADLALSNQQAESGAVLQSKTKNFAIYDTIQNLADSTAQVSDDTGSSSALGNNASNAIDTSSGAGIDLISGLAALTSEQTGTADSSAVTQYGGITINAGSVDSLLSPTNASLTLAGDQITSTAGVNQINNALSLSASTIDSGTLGVAGGAAFLSGAAGGSQSAGAGISLDNEQNVTGSGYADAVEFGVNISAYLTGDTLSNDSVVITNPVLLASATANSATNSVSADGSQGISGSIGVLNTQQQLADGSDAYLGFGEDGYGGNAQIIEQTDGFGAITGSSALLSGASLAAKATDNYASNTLDAVGGVLPDTVSGTVGVAAQLSFGNAAAQSSTDLALASVQRDGGEPSEADVERQFAYIDANAAGGTIASSSFTVSGPADGTPTVQALALANEAVNMLTAAASTMMQDTAGLVNAQQDTTGADATVDVSGVYVQVNGAGSSFPTVEGNDGGDVNNISVTAGTGAVGGSYGNLLRALAYGNQASNVLSASAGQLRPAATGPLDYSADGAASVISTDSPFDTDNLAEPDVEYGVGAAYAVLNDQHDSGDVSASVTDSGVGTYIGNTTSNPLVTNVTESTAGNAVVSSVFGNQATNSATADTNDVYVGSYTPLVDVTNLQTSTETTYQADLNSIDDTFLSQVAGTGQVTDSTIGVTNNTAITQVEANQAANSLQTTGGNITDTSETRLGGVSAFTFDAGDATDSAAFTVNNVQYDESGVTVEQPFSDALVAIGGAVDVSSLAATGNAFQSTGYENNATNSLAFGGTDSPVDVLDSSSGLQNVQYSEGGDYVTLGSAGTLASAGTPDTVIPAVDYSVAAGTNSGVLTNNGQTLQVEGNPLIFDLSGLDSEQRTEFESLFSGGTTFVSGSNFTLSTGTYTLSSTDIFGSSDGNAYHTSGGALEDQPTYEEVTLDDGTPATPAVPPSPSVLITVGGNITASTLNVSNNAFDATALANNAVTTQNIAATTVNGGAGLSDGAAGGEVSGYEASTAADYALTNLQSNGETVSASGNGEVGINPVNTSTISNSTLTVSNNTQLTKAEADVGSNTLSLAATSTAGTPPTMALASYQYNDSNVTAASGSTGDSFEPGYVVTAPGAISGSTLAMDNNSSESLAAANDVTNLLSASATTLDTAYAEDSNSEAGTDVEVYTYGDYSLTNAQLAQGNNDVVSTDVTQIINSDFNTATTSGLVSSTVDISGNTTSAFAEANIASNTLDMSATNSTANGALLNEQTSSATVLATGSSEVVFGLNGAGAVGDPDNAAATGSAINISNNTLQAQGIGNQATNALNADTGATYGTQSHALANPTDVQATYAVLNSQTNEAEVSATGSASIYSGLNGADSDAPVLNTTVTVSYNVVDAKAFGNSADNSMTIAALNSGNATAALQNTQTNAGAITANVSGTQIGSDIYNPGASNATVVVGNNSVVASAIGNVATNSIAH